MEIEARLGPYEIRERIGEGGMATVYRAWHVGLHRFEALKVPRRGYGGDTEFVHRLLSEARTAARLHHPHIVGIHSISDDGAQQPYFSMDLVEGRDLESLLEERDKLPFSEALSIVRAIASALDYAHSQGVLHRDIKPANILLQSDESNNGANGWTVKVVDFGISRAGEDTGGTRLTKSGMLVGTPEYMSPEQAGSGEIVDGRSDNYSLGVVAYEMLTGRPPFTAGEGVSRMSILMSHVRDAPRPPTELASLPAHVDMAIARALAKNPADRFDSCAEFVRALEAPLPLSAPAPQLNGAAISGVAPHKNAIAAPSEIAPVVDNRRSSHRMALPIAVAVAIIMACATVFLWLWGAQVPPRTPDVSNVVVPTPAAPIEAATAVPTPIATATATVVATPTIALKRVTQRRAIAFSRETRSSQSLRAGRTRIVQRGENGVREVTLEIAMRGESELSRRVVAQRVLKSPVAQIQSRGIAGAPAAPSLRRRVRRRSVTKPNVTARRNVRRRLGRAPRKRPRAARNRNRPIEAPLPP